MKKFTAYNDPAHGWVKVPKTLLVELGIEGEISNYSYQRGDFAYLEEDCDATVFIRAYAAKHGILPVIVDRYSNKSSKVRSYAGYRV